LDVGDIAAYALAAAVCYHRRRTSYQRLRATEELQVDWSKLVKRSPAIWIGRVFPRTASHRQKHWQRIA